MGLLDAIDRVLGTRIGLLVSDPRAAINALESDARAFNQASLLATQAERNAARGLPVSPEQLAAKRYIDQKNEDLAMGFAGTTNVGKPTYYHGTNKDFQNFVNRLTYFTQDPMQASSYAGTVGANVRPVNLEIKKTYTGRGQRADLVLGCSGGHQLRPSGGRFRTRTAGRSRSRRPAPSGARRVPPHGQLAFHHDQP